MKYRQFTKKELDWIAELERIMKKAPGNLFIFAGAGTMTVYPERYMNHIGSVDGNAHSTTIRCNCEIDGAIGNYFY